MSLAMSLEKSSQICLCLENCMGMSSEMSSKLSAEMSAVSTETA